LKVGGAYPLPGPRERVYTLLLEPEVLCRCMPGCKHLERTAENEYAIKMNVAISSISGLFDGTVRVADLQQPESFRLVVDGCGRAGFVKGDGVLSLSDSGGATEVRYDGEIQAGGLIAGVGQRLLETTARMLIKRFFDRLGEEVETRA
jgi:carbon monoxide dehydrogenase subunit G